MSLLLQRFRFLKVNGVIGEVGHVDADLFKELDMHSHYVNDQSPSLLAILGDRIGKAFRPWQCDAWGIFWNRCVWTKIWDGGEELQYTVNITQSPWWSEASFVGGVILMAAATWLTLNDSAGYFLHVRKGKIHWSDNSHSSATRIDYFWCLDIRKAFLFAGPPF